MKVILSIKASDKQGALQTKCIADLHAVQLNKYVRITEQLGIYFFIVTICPKLQELQIVLSFSNTLPSLINGQHFGESVFKTICRLSEARLASLRVKVCEGKAYKRRKRLSF